MPYTEEIVESKEARTTEIIPIERIITDYYAVETKVEYIPRRFRKPLLRINQLRDFRKEFNTSQLKLKSSTILKQKKSTIKKVDKLFKVDLPMLMEDQEQDKPQLHVRLVEFIQLEDQLMFQVETTKLDQPINLEICFRNIWSQTTRNSGTTQQPAYNTTQTTYVQPNTTTYESYRQPTYVQGGSTYQQGSTYVSGGSGVRREENIEYRYQ